MGLLLILGPIVLPEYKDPQVGQLDLISAAMSLVAVLAVIFGLKQMAQDGIGLLPVSAIWMGLAIGFLWAKRQLRLQDPMIDIRLLKIRAFRASLAVNFLAVFVAFGYFLFVAQYLQLVVGLSPFQAGLWSLPSAIGFILGSNVAPRIARRFSPPHIIGSCLSLAAVGLLVLTQVGGTHGLVIVVVASVLISLGLGLAPVFGLTTEFIVGSAPPEQAGAASGMSETAAELGGALGIAIFGSIGIALYRAGLTEALPKDIPPEVAIIARDTLGAAAGVAHTLPHGRGEIFLEVARNAFVQGMQAAAMLGAVVAILSAFFSLKMLKNVRSNA
jgi:DHA2 family multidrug resistance protein-like MFS transporter